VQEAVSQRAKRQIFGFRLFWGRGSVERAAKGRPGHKWKHTVWSIRVAVVIGYIRIAEEGLRGALDKPYSLDILVSFITTSMASWGTGAAYRWLSARRTVF